MVLRRPYIKGLCGERLEKSALDHSSNHCYYTLTTTVAFLPFISIASIYFPLQVSSSYSCELHFTLKLWTECVCVCISDKTFFNI